MSHARLSYTFKNYRPKKLDKLLSLRKNSECSGADSVLTRSGFGNNAKFDGLLCLTDINIKTQDSYKRSANEPACKKR